MYDGLKGFLRIVPSGEAHPPNLLITGHSSDPAGILPAFVNIAFVTPFCADFASAVNSAVPSVCSSPLV